MAGNREPQPPIVEGENNGNIPRNPFIRVRPHRPATMDNFKEVLSDATYRGEAVHVFAPKDTVNFLLPTTNRIDNETVFHTAVSLFGAEDITGNQLCAYYLSAICSVFVELIPVAKQTLIDIGANCDDVLIPSEAADNVINVREMPDTAEGNVHFGQLLLCLYKNISDASFTPFMTKRTNALRAIAGVDPTRAVSYAISFNRAMRIKAMLGNCIALRKSVLENIMATARAPSNLGATCLYVSRIIQWTEMTALVIVMETLLLTNSPVLTDITVKNEVRVLAEGYKFINQTRYPQYFKILADPEHHGLVERSRYPILSAVAHKIRQTDIPSLSRFVKTTAASEATINRLVQMHQRYINSRSALTAKNAISYLTGFDNDQDDNEPIAPPAE